MVLREEKTLKLEGAIWGTWAEKRTLGMREKPDSEGYKRVQKWLELFQERKGLRQQEEHFAKEITNICKFNWRCTKRARDPRNSRDTCSISERFYEYLQILMKVFQKSKALQRQIRVSTTDEETVNISRDHLDCSREGHSTAGSWNIRRAAQSSSRAARDTEQDPREL